MPHEPVKASSAFRHGVSANDIDHAIRHCLHVFSMDEEMTMVVGVGTDGVLLEVGLVSGVDADVVVHAMRARLKFIRGAK